MRKLFFILLALTSITTAFSTSVTIRIQFPYFYSNPRCTTQIFPDLVGISHDPTWNENVLVRSGDSYYYNTSVNPNLDFLFSIRFTLTSLTTRNYWINSKGGSSCANVFVNNNLLDASYMTTNGLGGSNFAIRFDNNNNLVHAVTYPPLQIDARVPPEVALREETIEYARPADSLTVPYGRVQSWLVGIHDNNFPDSSSKIEVDYVKLFSKNKDGSESLLYFHDYGWNFDSVNQGGLYMRYPWFVNDAHIPMPAVNINSALTMYPNTRQFVAWHWWDTARSVINTAFHKHYKIEVKMRISGKSCVQLGYDYWRTIDTVGMNDTMNHREVACSNWYFAAPNWQTIVFDPWIVNAIQPISTEIPEKFSLSQNYPNPFNPNTNIVFDIKSKGKVQLTVFDETGREIEKLVNEVLSPGSYKVNWDARSYASGIYFCKLETGDFAETRKMVLIK